MSQNSPIQSLIATMMRLDSDPDVTDLVQFIQDSQHDPHDLMQVLPELLVVSKLRPAFLLAMFFNNQGFQSPVISIALSLGGWLFNKPEEEQRGLETLRTQADGLSFDQQKLLYDKVLYPILLQLLGNALAQSDHRRVLRILDLYKALFPRFRTLFDWNAAVPTLSLAELRQRGRAEARLISYPLPPHDMPRQRRRAVIAMRERFYFGNAASRLSDFGPRILAAMQAYGWDAVCCDFKCASLGEMVDDCHAIIETCRQQQAELLIIDLNVTLKAAVRDEMILLLRQENPSIRVVGCLIDGFCFPEKILIESATHLDLIWTRDVPFLPAWRAPALANKVFNLLFPNAGIVGMLDKPLIPKPLFAGGVTAKFLPHRAFWLAGIAHLGLPIQTKVSSHQEDGLSPLDSFAVYMRGLTESTCCLSLAMRYDQSYVVTFRSFEVVLSGALLVQESTPEMQAYFVAGDHYLDFSTLAELASVIRFMTENPEEAEEIRRCGHAFACERYKDDKIIGYLDKRLFFSEEMPSPGL